MPPAPPEIAAPRTCLVTGATGALGPAVIAALAGAGHAVRALVRHAPEPGLFPPGVDVRHGDITDARALEEAMAGVGWLFHLAARLHVVAPPPSMRAEYQRVNVDGTRLAVEAAERAGVRRLVFFSTIAVYGYSSGQPLNEASPVRPDTIYGETKYAAEALILAARGPAGERIGTVLRLAAVYGPRVKGNYRRLLVALARRRFIPIGAGTNRRTLVFEEDAARAAVIAAARDDAAGEIFNVTDGGVHEVREIVQAICAALGRRPPALTLPVAAARVAAGALDLMRSAVGDRRNAARAALAKYLEDVAVDGSKLLVRLGFTPAFDLESGWRKTVRVMRDRADL